MRRVSTDMPNADMQYYLRRQEEGLNNIQSKIAGQTKIRELRDDPLAASHAVRYESYLARLERFEKNTLYARDHYQVTHDYLYETTDVLQRIRDLSVQGANGIYTPEDMKLMASEVNELIKEMVALSNSTGPDGKQVFAGDKAFTEPFRAVEGTVPGGGESMVVRVEYRGAGASRKTEVTDGVYSELDIGGGEAFWAEKMQVLSTVDATDYRAAADGAFFVDGVEIPVNTGDTLHAIVAKINDSSAPVKAYVDPETRGLALEGTNAHLIRMEDRQDSSVLRDLGIIRQNSDTNAPNWSNTARVSGGSVFDMAIRLRDALYRGDRDFVGSQGIGGIDLALGNVTSRLAEISSRSERADMTWKRLNQEIPDVTARLSRETGLDFATAAMELAQMDFAHKASLQVAAKILPTTLLDFLR
ncbi:flagellar hook-associated protein FlgL [Spirochaetia bacterium]|nr:flagellar hook-associated protein FlgL [Spirochaetia bacterium]